MEERKLVFTPGVDSMASLWALLPAVHARQVFDTVNAVAQVAGRDDVRTMDQRRADALVDLVTGRAAPPQVRVQVVVSEAALAGSFAPPEVTGVGPVLPDDLAELLQSADGDVTFRLLLPPGRYRVEASAPDFKTGVRTRVGLEVEGRARVDFRLEIGPVTVSVTVEAYGAATASSARPTWT